MMDDAHPSSLPVDRAISASPDGHTRRGVRGNKRARLVCMRCHDKKVSTPTPLCPCVSPLPSAWSLAVLSFFSLTLSQIKCDLQSTAAGIDGPKCTRCQLSGYECR